MKKRQQNKYSKKDRRESLNNCIANLSPVAELNQNKNKLPILLIGTSYPTKLNYKKCTKTIQVIGQRLITKLKNYKKNK